MSGQDTGPVTVVSGLPRSGTSLVMAMLANAGLEPMTDAARRPDDDNPRGYWELERVKRLPRDNTWLAEARGRLLKVVSPLLAFLPAGLEYQVVLVERELTEVLASQHRMLARRGEKAAAADQVLLDRYQSHLAQVRRWLATTPGVRSCTISYNALFTGQREGELARLAAFFSPPLAVDRLAAVIDPALYRNRRPAA